MALCKVPYKVFYEAFYTTYYRGFYRVFRQVYTDGIPESILKVRVFDRVHNTVGIRHKGGIL